MVRAFGFIDVQNDFMNSNGALYVPNAESIKENIRKLVDFAEHRVAPIFFTQDQHEPTDPEMNTVGGPFPPHCLKDTVGAENIIEATTFKKSPVIFEKRCYDVFDPKLGNPNFKKWLKDGKFDEVWLAGVVGNICMEAIAIGLRKLYIDVCIFENATVWMNLENGIFCKGLDNKEKSVERLREIGCHLVTCGL
jgi:nicotinamidase/pyrazinamidase